MVYLTAHRITLRHELPARPVRWVNSHWHKIKMEMSANECTGSRIKCGMTGVVVMYTICFLVRFTCAICRTGKHELQTRASGCCKRVSWIPHQVRDDRSDFHVNNRKRVPWIPACAPYKTGQAGMTGQVMMKIKYQRVLWIQR